MTFPLKSTATQSVVVGHETAAKSVTPATFVAVQLAAPPVGSVEVVTYPTWSTATQSVVDGQETWPKGRPYVWSPKSNFAGADQPNAPPAAAPADEAPNGTPTRTTAPNASQCHDRRKVRGRLRLGRSTINPGAHALRPCTPSRSCRVRRSAPPSRGCPRTSSWRTCPRADRSRSARTRVAPATSRTLPPAAPPRFSRSRGRCCASPPRSPASGS